MNTLASIRKPQDAIVYVFLLVKTTYRYGHGPTSGSDAIRIIPEIACARLGMSYAKNRRIKI